MSLSQVVSKGSGLPSRYIVYGVPGVGKTSFAAQVPRVVFIQVGGETGLETLIDARQLPYTPHFPPSTSWPMFLDTLRALNEDEHDFAAVAVDTLDTLQELCYAEVSRRDFGGNRDRKSWLNFNAGPIASTTEWRAMLALVDQLREKRKMAFVGLCHSAVVTFKNPQGADYDRYQASLDKAIWSVTKDWSDATLFLNFETFVDSDDPKKKGKAAGGQTRVMYCQNHAAYDAKSRFGLPAEIVLGDSPEDSWANFIAARKAAPSLN